MKSAFISFSMLFVVLLLTVSKSYTQCNDWLKMVPGTYLGGVDVGNISVSGNQLTVEAVFNRDVANTAYPLDRRFDGDIVSKHSSPSDVNYLLRPNNAEITTDSGYFTTTINSSSTVCRIELNKTYHVAMVYDGVALKFYRNGILLTQVPATGNMVTNNLKTLIGGFAGPTAGPYPAAEEFRGYINEVRIWNVARSQTDLQGYMNTQLPSPTLQPGLLAYYTFNSLANKQGNPAFDGNFTPLGTPQNTASINEYNPTCAGFIADSCPLPPPPPPITLIPCDEFLDIPTSTSAMLIGDLDIVGNQLTVECVFNPRAQNTAYFGGDLISKHGSPANSNYLLRPLRAEITNTSGQFFKTNECRTTMDLNVTQHAAMVYNGSSLRFYIRGILQDSVPASGNLFQNNFLTAIGILADTRRPNRENFNGLINEVRIWNVARTQAEIATNMNQPLPNPTTTPGLVAYYVFNSTANKQGASQWNGTLYGSAAINQQNSDLCRNGLGYGGCSQPRVSSSASSDPKGGSTNNFSALQAASLNEELALDLALSPNPAKDYVVINLSQTKNNTQLQIVDILGRVSKSIQLKAGTAQTKVDLHGLSKGVYRVILTNKKETKSVPLVIE